MADPSDRDLVRQVRRGDVDAFGVLVKRYQQSVFNVCFRMLGERREAEDLAQESFLRAFQKLDYYDARRPFGPWVHRLTANLCLNHIKGRKPVPFELDEQRDATDAPTSRKPERENIRRELRERVRAAILDLPAHYRAVIELRHYQGLAYKEIAQTLEIPMSDVKSHLYRARKQLRHTLQEDTSDGS